MLAAPQKVSILSTISRVSYFPCLTIHTTILPQTHTLITALLYPLSMRTSCWLATPIPTRVRIGKQVFCYVDIFSVRFPITTIGNSTAPRHEVFLSVANGLIMRDNHTLPNDNFRFPLYSY